MNDADQPPADSGEVMSEDIARDAESASEPTIGNDLHTVDSRQILSNQQALARYWVKVQPSVTAFIHAAVSQYHDAEDILQDVAAEVAVHFHEYDPERPFLPWALWIAKLKIADFYRSRKRQQNVLTTQTIDALAVACAHAHVSLREETEALERCLSKLTVRSRYLLSLRYEEGLKPAAIAERLNTSPGAVRVTLTRIRDAVAECMKRQLEDKRN